MSFSDWILGRKPNKIRSNRTVVQKKYVSPFTSFGLESLDGRVLPSASFGGVAASLRSGISFAAATHFQINVTSNTYANEPATVTVIALDANNRQTSNYTGTISFSSTDLAAVLPADYTFTTSDRGRHTFSITPSTTGSQTLSVTDINDKSITGSIGLSVNPTQVATHFEFQCISQATAGQAATFKLVALDANNQQVLNYTGTVSFSSSDGSALLPSTYTFSASDQGSKTFSVTFSATGSQTLTATSSETTPITGTATVNVTSTPAFHGRGRR